MLAAHLRDIRNIGAAIRRANNILAELSSLPAKSKGRAKLLAEASKTLNEAEQITHDLHTRANEQLLNLAEELHDVLPAYKD